MTDHPHGDVHKYWLGCKCRDCKTAFNTYMAEYKTGLKGIEPPKHNNTGYTTYGHRCPECRAAHTATNKAQREARK